MSTAVSKSPTTATSAVWFGYNAPFIGGNEAVLSRQTDTRIVQNDLLQLLLTSPGERIMRPTFGSPIRQFVFEGMVQSDLINLENQILQVIQNNEPRVVPTSVTVTPDDNNNLNIKVYGIYNLDTNNTINSNAKNNTLLIELSLPTNPLNQLENGGVAGQGLS